MIGFYMARCDLCACDMPFYSEAERDEWAAAHREFGHERAEVATWTQEVIDIRGVALDLLHELVDHETDECCYDHDGFCQTHYHDGIDRGGCTIYRARKFLAEVDPRKEDHDH